MVRASRGRTTASETLRRRARVFGGVDRPAHANDGDGDAGAGDQGARIGHGILREAFREYGRDQVAAEAT